MDRVSAFEARNRLITLLGEVERGQEVVITRNGRAVARLIPADRPAEPPDRPRAAAAALRALRAGIAARGVRFTTADLTALRDEGRP